VSLGPKDTSSPQEHINPTRTHRTHKDTARPQRRF